MAKSRADELKAKIAQLEGMGESDSDTAKKYKAELAKLDPPTATVEGIMLPATDEEWEKGGSKFVTIAPGQTSVDLAVEVGMPVEETPGKSVAFPVTVTQEGPDEGKEDKIVGGILPGKTFKTKEIVEAVTGKPCPYAKGKDGKMHPVIPLSIAGAPAIGHWEMQTGHKGGDPNAETVKYPKLIAILPTKKAEKALGI